MSTISIKNRKTKWSFERKTHKCSGCKHEINQSWWYEVFDDKGNSKGPHHFTCAERQIDFEVKK
jgi:hypothetical protein